MQKLMTLILSIVLIAAVADAALLKTVAKSITKDASAAKSAAETNTKETEEKPDAPKLSLAAAKAAAQAVKKKKTKEPTSFAATCAVEGVFPTPNKPCCEGLELRSGVCRPVQQENPFPGIHCAEEGSPGVQRPCCEGLTRDNALVCRRSCAREGEAAWQGIPCCMGLAGIGAPPICVNADRSCRQAGEPYSLFRRDCCEGLQFDEETLECNPRRVAVARPPPARAASPGCTAEQLNRIEQKLDELLGRR